MVQLRQLAEEEGLTLYTVFLTALAIVLSNYANQTDILIGTPVVNREHPQLAELLKKPYIK